jgi:uncharacterized protein (DUF1684 family)
MTALTLVDWRRRVFALYAEVRELSAAGDVRAAHERWRLTRDDLLAHHPDSPLPEAERARFSGLTVAPYDPAFRFEVEIDTEVPPLRIEVPTATDGVIPYERVGVAHLPGLGPLDVWWLASYGGGVFVPVKDALAGARTYGGGRYVLDTVKGADLGGSPTDGRLVIDLNFAYNPSCAYDARWSCPLAPPGNVLGEPVPAGELSVG